MARVCGNGMYDCNATGNNVDETGFCSIVCQNIATAYDDSQDKKIEDFAINAVLAVLDCNTCCGSPPENGNVCICGGSGLARDELLNMRLELFKARERIAELEKLLYGNDDKRIASLTGVWSKKMWFSQ